MARGAIWHTGETLQLPVFVLMEMSMRPSTNVQLAWIPTERKWLTFDLAVTRVFPENPRAPTIQRVSVSLER